MLFYVEKNFWLINQLIVKQNKGENMKDIEKTLINIDSTIEDAVAVIQEGGVGIALVVDDKKFLLGTVTDGDIRRAILWKIPLSSNINKILDIGIHANTL